MASLTMAQAYAYARQAGFDPAAAVIAAAIAAGESGLNPGAVGDEALADATWGPSVGLMQVRTLKAQTGTGGTRDINRLRDPAQNMAAAYEISSHGKNWTPWSVYNSGKYRQFLGQAQQASTAGGGYVPGATVVPASWTADAGAKLGQLAATGTVVVLGVVLVLVGAVRATGSGPALRRLGKRAAVAVAL